MWVAATEGESFRFAAVTTTVREIPVPLVRGRFVLLFPRSTGGNSCCLPPQALSGCTHRRRDRSGLGVLGHFVGDSWEVGGWSAVGGRPWVGLWWLGRGVGGLVRSWFEVAGRR